MDKKPDGPKTGVFVGLGLGMVICCAGITLVAAGALSGLGAWLFDGGLTWLALAFILGVGGVFLWRRQKSSAVDTNPVTTARCCDSKPSVTKPE